MPADQTLDKLASDSSESASFLRLEATLRAGRPAESQVQAQTFASTWPGSALTHRARLVEAWSDLATGEHRKGCQILATLLSGGDPGAVDQARATLMEWVRSGNLPLADLLLLPSLVPEGEDSLVRAISQAVPGRPLVAVLPGSGSFAQIGRRVVKGAQLAAAEAKVALVVLDEPQDPIEAAFLVRGLLKVSRPRAIVGPLLSNTAALVALEVARTAPDIPLILPAATSPGISSLGPSVWQVNITTREQGIKASEIARSCLGAGEAYMLWPKSEFGEAVSDGFREDFVRGGGRIAFQRSFAPGATDFRSLLDALKKSALELARKRGKDTSNLAPVVFVPGENPSEALALAAQASQAGLKVRWIGASGWHSRQFLLETSGRMDGAILVTDNIPDERRPTWKTFAQKWKASEGDAADRLAALGWDAAQLALQPKVPLEFAGAQADLKFDAKTRMNKAVGVVRAEKGAFVAAGCPDK